MIARWVRAITLFEQSLLEKVDIFKPHGIDSRTKEKEAGKEAGKRRKQRKEERRREEEKKHEII